MLRLALALLVVAAPALAHDWYPRSCCHEFDCKPVPVTDVVIQGGAYIVTWGGQSIRYEDARPSPDGQYHVCTRSGRPDGELMNARPGNLDGIEPGPCFWAPMGM